MPSQAVVQGQEPPPVLMFATVQPQEHKCMLRVRLFNLVLSMDPDLAHKITDMLLELNNSELLHMLEKP